MVGFKTISLLFNKQIRRTKHFQEWYKLPKNYVRIKEFEFVENRLEFQHQLTTLDLSSPKWLSFQMLYEGFDVIVSDMNDYFVEDFRIFNQYLLGNCDIRCFDAKKIPFENDSIDQVFSVSVLEHVPDNGDNDIMKEVERVLKPDGIALITLPAANEYLEEWTKSKSFYWNTKSSNEKVFYQRRYDVDSINKRLSVSGLSLEEIVFIAEKPIKEPFFSEEGMLMHNAYYITENKVYSAVRRFDKRFMPLTDYFFHKYFSSKYHYFTLNEADKNIRQVCLKFKKS